MNLIQRGKSLRRQQLIQNQSPKFINFSFKQSINRQTKQRKPRILDLVQRKRLIQQLLLKRNKPLLFTKQQLLAQTTIKINRDKQAYNSAKNMISNPILIRGLENVGHTTLQSFKLKKNRNKTENSNNKFKRQQPIILSGWINDL